MNNFENRKKKIKCEVWKDIPQYKGFYQASSFGNIRSLDRKIKQLSNGGKTYFTYIKKGKVLAQGIQNGGYPVVSISINSKRKICTVHRLVASAFIENPNNYSEVNHRDGDKKNNCAENLEWVERSENIRHSYHELGQRRHYKPIRCIDTDTIYPSCKEASLITGINVSSINHAVNGLSHYAGGMKWERI